VVVVDAVDDVVGVVLAVVVGFGRVVVVVGFGFVVVVVAGRLLAVVVVVARRFFAASAEGAVAVAIGRARSSRRATTAHRPERSMRAR
jgi:predicted lipid-binding transport protein (Tim44 family)